MFPYSFSFLIFSCSCSWKKSFPYSGLMPEFSCFFPSHHIFIVLDWGLLPCRHWAATHVLCIYIFFVWYIYIFEKYITMLYWSRVIAMEISFLELAYQLIHNTSNCGGRKLKHIFDHQGWVQKLSWTKDYTIVDFDMEDCIQSIQNTVGNWIYGVLGYCWLEKNVPLF